jgi:hypothetical protein
MVDPRTHFLVPHVRAKVVKRAIANATDLLNRHHTQGNLITAADLFLRQRSYISNNFLQNLHEREPCLPFMHPELVTLKRTHPTSDFGVSTYRRIFEMHAPNLMMLPHNKELNETPASVGLSEVERSSIGRLLREVALNGYRGAVDRAYVLPRLALARVTRRYAYAVAPILFLSMLIRVCEAYDIDLEW